MRSSSGWRSTMSTSLSPSRYWPTVVPDRIVREACAMRLAGDAERARLVLVDVQAQHLDRLVPVVVDAAHVRVRRAGSPWPRRPRRAPARASGPTTRNCTGYGTGGPLGSSLTRPRTSGNSLGQQRRQPLAQRLARRHVLRQHDRSGSTLRLRKDLVERQIEARHAAADPRRDAGDAVGSFIMRASKRLAPPPRCSAIVEPSGSHRSTRISGRLESGKNCCCTAAHAGEAEREA